MMILIGNVESVSADILKFDQLHVIIIDHTDIITFIDDTTPYETSNSVQVTLSSQLETKDFQLYQESGTNIFRTIVKFTSGAISASNELRVVSENTVTLSKAGLPNDTVKIKLATGTNPNPSYGNNKFTTNSANCDNGLGGDPDGDGICSNWEGPTGLTIGYPSGGPYTLSYPNAGVLELRAPDDNLKDFYLEIDYMQGHKPNVEAIWDVIRAFDSMGIGLHVQIDDEDTSDITTKIPHATCTKFPGSNVPSTSKGFDQIAGSYFGTLSERGSDWNTNGWERKHQVFHYALFTHAQCGSTSSGVGEIGGDEVMITLGVLTDVSEPVSPEHIAGTLMHELGHNLNLNHGGAYGDTKNCKPTHLSVMSYARQWTDLVPNRNLEFSRQIVNLEGDNTLTENTINEQLGIGPYSFDPQEEITWGPTPPLNRAIVGTSDVDWNGINGIETTPYTQNLNTITANGKVVCPSTLDNESLGGHNDLGALVYNIRSDGDWQDGVSVGSGTIIESNFCLPVARILSILPSNSPQPLLDFFNKYRSCQGGRGETDASLILLSFQNATSVNGTVTLTDLENLVELVSNQSSDELTSQDMIIMRLARIDSIMTYLKNTPDDHFKGSKKNLFLNEYAVKTDKIKKDIQVHKLLDVLAGLSNIYNSYSANIINSTTLNNLKSGTADIYLSINKAVLGPALSSGATTSVIYNGKINPINIAELKILLPDLFEDGDIKKDYKTYIKNGNLLITKWEIVDEGGKIRHDVTYLKPLKLQNKNTIDLKPEEVVCNPGFHKVYKPDGKAICVKDTSIPRLVSLGYIKAK